MTQNSRSMSPFVESSLKVSLDMMHLILTITELIPYKLSHGNILLPSIHDIRKPLPFGLSYAPSYYLFSQQATSAPIYFAHHIFYFVICVMLFGHEVLKVFDFALGFPVFSSNRSTVIHVILELGLLVLLMPSVEGLSRDPASDLGPESFEFTIRLFVGTRLIQKSCKCYLKLLIVCLPHHPHTVCGSNHFIAAVRNHPMFSIRNDLLERLGKYFCPHHLLECTQVLCQITNILVVIFKASEHWSYFSSLHFLDQ